jgi:hypothetical protein
MSGNRSLTGFIILILILVFIAVFFLAAGILVKIRSMGDIEPTGRLAERGNHEQSGQSDWGIACRNSITDLQHRLPDEPDHRAGILI